MNASCSSLYPGTVTVHLSPTGWIPGDILTINGGVATATLNNSSISAPSVTLGTTSVTPTPANVTTLLQRRDGNLHPERRLYLLFV